MICPSGAKRVCCPLGAPLCAPCALGVDTYEALLALDCPESHMQSVCLHVASGQSDAAFTHHADCLLVFFGCVFAVSRPGSRLGGPGCESPTSGSTSSPPGLANHIFFRGFSCGWLQQSCLHLWCLGKVIRRSPHACGTGGKRASFANSLHL